MEKYYTKRYESFKRCLSDLTDAKTRDYKNDSFVKSGVTSKFSLTFDLSWKVMKDIIGEYYNITDYATGSPSENLKMAFKVGLIEDDSTWKEMLHLRNELAHDYNGILADEACEHIVHTYIDFLLKFEESIDAFILGES